MSAPEKVPVGVSTVAGLVSAVTGGVVAVVSLAHGGSGDEATVGAIVGGVVALGSLVTVVLGRVAQAIALIRAASRPQRGSRL